jgi:hypothetical protein
MAPWSPLGPGGPGTASVSSTDVLSHWGCRLKLMVAAVTGAADTVVVIGHPRSTAYVGHDRHDKGFGRADHVAITHLNIAVQIGWRRKGCRERRINKREIKPPRVNCLIGVKRCAQIGDQNTNTCAQLGANSVRTQWRGYTVDAVNARQSEGIAPLERGRCLHGHLNILERRRPPSPPLQRRWR